MEKKVDNSRNVLLHCEAETVVVNLDKLVRSKVTLIDICKILKKDSVVKVSKPFQPIDGHGVLTDFQKKKAKAVVSKRKTENGTKVKESKNAKNCNLVSNQKNTPSPKPESTKFPKELAERFVNDSDRKEITFVSESNASKSNLFDKVPIKNTEKTEHLEGKPEKGLANINKKETSDISEEQESWSRLVKQSEFEPVETRENGSMSVKANASSTKSMRFVNAKFVVKNRLGFHSEKPLKRGSFEDIFRKKLMRADIKKLTESLDKKSGYLSSEDDFDLSSEENLNTQDGKDNVNDGKKISEDDVNVKTGKEENLERIMEKLLRLLNSLKNDDLLVGCWNKVMPSVRSPTGPTMQHSPTASRCSLPSMPSLEEKVERINPRQRKFVTRNLENRVPNKRETIRAEKTLSELKGTFYAVKKGFKIPKIQKIQVGQKGAKLWVQGLTVDETGTYEVNENGKRILSKSGKMLKSRAITQYALLDDWKDLSGSHGLNQNFKLNEMKYPAPESLKEPLFISSPRKGNGNSGVFSEFSNLLSFKNCPSEMSDNISIKSEDTIDDADLMEKEREASYHEVTEHMNAMPQEKNRLLNVNAEPGIAEGSSHVTTSTSVSLFGPLVSNWIAKKKLLK